MGAIIAGASLSSSNKSNPNKQTTLSCDAVASKMSETKSESPDFKLLANNNRDRCSGNAEFVLQEGIGQHQTSSSTEEYSKALALFNKAISLNPERAAAYYWRGSALDSLENYQEALEDFSKSIDLDPKDYLSYHRRALIKYYDLNKSQEALYDINQAIELIPQDSDTESKARLHDLRANIQMDLKDYERALADANLSISLDNNDRYSYRTRSYIKSWLEDGQGVCQDLRKAKELGLTEVSFGEDKNDSIDHHINEWCEL